MICPKCKAEIESDTYCIYCGCDVQEALEEQKRKKKNLIIISSAIGILFTLALGFFSYSMFMNSNFLLRYKFTQALNSGDYEQAIEYTNAQYSKFVTPEKVKELFKDRDNIPVITTGKKVDYIFHECKIDLARYIKEPSFYFPKGTRVIFNGEELVGIECADENAQLFSLNKVLVGTYSLEVQCPLCKAYKNDNFKITEQDMNFNSTAVLTLKDGEIPEFKKAVFDSIVTIYEGVASGKSFDELEPYKNYNEDAKEGLKGSYNILLQLFFDGSSKQNFSTEEFKIEALQIGDIISLTSDFNFQAVVTINYSFTMSDSEDKGKDTFNKESNITVELQKIDGEWKIISFSVPSYAI